MQDEYFQTDKIRQNLKRRSVRSAGITMLAQGIKFVLQTGSTIVLARLLVPQDFGLIGMATAVTGFVALFKDLGLTVATVQQEKITHQQVSNLFWINVGVSAILMIFTMAIAPLVGRFYANPRVVAITAVIALGYIAGGLTMQHQALMQRQMRFGVLGVIDVAALTAGILTGILAAYWGAGCWALVWMQLTTAIVNAIAVWMLCDWRPSWLKRETDIRELLKFGGNLMGSNVLGYVGQNIDNLLIGRYYGSEQLGYYTRAYALMLQPMQQIMSPINAVVIPTLSRLTVDPVKFRQAVLSLLEKLILLAAPAATYLIVTSDWWIALLLGPRWGPAAKIFQVLGLAVYGQTLTAPAIWILTTQGLTARLFRWSVGNVCLVVAAIILGLRWGAVGVATSYAVSGLVLRVPLLLWCATRQGSVRLGDLYKVAIPHLLLSAVALVLLWLVRQHIHFSGPLTGLLATGGMALVFYGGGLGSFPFGRRALRDFGLTLSLLR